GPTMIITAIGAFEGNPHDRQTIQPLLEPQESIVGLAPKELVYDRGGRGKRPMGQTKKSMPGKPLKRDTPIKNKRRGKSADAERPWSHSSTTSKQNIVCKKTTGWAPHRQRSMPIWPRRGGIERNS
ncbi:MAG: hypothetical protein OXC64_03875, partial [Flavobacteriaceae bacterium]|nr:hypothetical protein [Flavobacteriaceae bacterium]